MFRYHINHLRRNIVPERTLTKLKSNNVNKANTKNLQMSRAFSPLLLIISA